MYSFRHSGAIEIFKRTGSITKLQKAMGHSSINVSLTYLRGLEIAELTEDGYAYVLGSKHQSDANRVSDRDCLVKEKTSL